MGSRRIPRSYLWTLTVLAALFFLILSSGWLLHAVARARLERAAGPLDVERFVRPAPPPENPGAQLLRAVASLDVSDADRDLLSETVNGGRSALLSNRPRLIALFEKNREPLQAARSLGQGESWLGIDYRERNWLPRDTYLQISLARMLYLQGLLALEERNSTGVLEAIRSLGRQAAILENEPGLVVQVFALTAERYQLRLAVSYLESGLGEPGSPAPASLLVRNDLRSRYRDAMVLGAISSQRLLDSLAERSGGWFLSRWTARFMGAGFLDRYRLYDQSYDRDYAWIQRRLSADPGSRRSFQEVWRSGGLDPDLLARYKATAASRALVRACQEAREAARRGAACRGGCTLRTVDGEEYLRLFGKRERFPAPQTCTLRINPPGSPPRTGPAPGDRSPGTATARSAPVP